MSSESEVRVAFSGQRWGHLEVVGGASRWRVDSLSAQAQAGAGEPALFEAAFDGVAPEVTVEGGRVRVSSPWWVALRMHGHGARVGLSRALPWALTVRGGLSAFHADLRGIRLRELVVEGGVRDVLLELDEATDHVPIRIHGGAVKLTIVRPHNTSMAVRVAGGTAGLTVDDMTLGSVGGGFAWESQPSATAQGARAAYYDLQILGGVSRLLVARASERATPASVPCASAAASACAADY